MLKHNSRNLFFFLKFLDGQYFFKILTKKGKKELFPKIHF